MSHQTFRLRPKPVSAKPERPVSRHGAKIRPRLSGQSSPRPFIPSGAAFNLSDDAALTEAVEELERRVIAEAPRRHDGNVSRASHDPVITPRGLRLKLIR